MNERIKELADKVERIRDLYNIGPVHRDAVEQFAESIVQECVDIIKGSKVNWNDSTILIDAIKDNFRVE